jgi:L-aspartate oxidase
VVAEVRRIVSTGAGVLRDAGRLRTALAELEGLRHHDSGLVGYLLVEAALRREESRGAHTRLDFPDTAPVGEHILTTGGAPTATTVPEEARELASEASRRAPAMEGTR